MGVTFKSNDKNFRETVITGILTSSAMTIASATELDIPAGEGVIVDSTTNPENITRTRVNWAADATFLVSQPNAIGSQFIYIDSTGTIQQQSTDLTNQERRDNIFLGVVEYESGSLGTVLNEPQIVQSTGNTLADFINYIPTSAKIEGAFIQPVDAQLSCYRDSGRYFGIGINHYSDSKDPNVLSLPAIGNSSTPLTYDVLLSNETIDSTGTSIFPKERDIAGVPTSLTGKRATIHYLFAYGTSKTFVQMGQNEYNDALAASAAADLDAQNFDFVDGLEDAILLAQIVIGNDASDFSDPTKAQIINRRHGGTSSGGSTTRHDSIQLLLPDGAEDTYPVGAGEIDSGTIDRILVVTNSGTIDFTVNIGGVNVTGLVGVSASSTQTPYTATANNTFVELDQINVVTSNDSTSVKPRITIEIIPG